MRKLAKDIRSGARSIAVSVRNHWMLLADALVLAQQIAIGTQQTARVAKCRPARNAKRINI